MKMILFRVWFSKIGELRPLCSSASTAASGPVQRRKIMKLLCFQPNITIILESPNRKNIKISSQCIPNNEYLKKVFHWLIEDLKIKKTSFQDTLCSVKEIKMSPKLIICKNLKKITAIYLTCSTVRQVRR